jgi:hypothetical protein
MKHFKEAVWPKIMGGDRARGGKPQRTVIGTIFCLD